MPPFSVGVAQVEERLRTLRRRLNLLALQDSLYLGGSVLLLAACLVVVLAVRGRATLFAVTLWAAGAASALAIAAAILRIRRRWLSTDDVIRFADHRAVLEDRLPTLLLEQTCVSPLKDLLLAQTLAAAPRWDVDVLAPRRIPRSALLLAGSLAALIVTSYFIRPPAIPMNMAAAMPPSPPPQPDQPEDRAPQGSQASQGNASAGGHPGAVSGAEAGQQVSGNTASGIPTTGMGKTGPTNAEHPGALQATKNPHRSDGIQRSQSPEGAAADGDSQRAEIAAQVQDAIRAAFGAQSLEHERTASEVKRQPPNGPPSSEPYRETDLARRETGSGAAQSRPSSPSQRPDHGEGHQPSAAGAAASAGHQTDQNGAQLFAPQAEPAAHGKASQNLPLKLNAFSSAAQSPSDIQPQKDAASAIPSAGGGGRTTTAPSDEQVPDAPVQKADVAPEHEALVRRIFSRDE